MAPLSGARLGIQLGAWMLWDAKFSLTPSAGLRRGRLPRKKLSAGHRNCRSSRLVRDASPRPCGGPRRPFFNNRPPRVRLNWSNSRTEATLCRCAVRAASHDDPAAGGTDAGPVPTTGVHIELVWIRSSCCVLHLIFLATATTLIGPPVSRNLFASNCGLLDLVFERSPRAVPPVLYELVVHAVDLALDQTTRHLRPFSGSVNKRQAPWQAPCLRQAPCPAPSPPF
jgi:hypothetical protein